MRFLNNPPHNRGIKISKGEAFQLSNKMLNPKIKVQKKDGKENIKHKPAIPPRDLWRWLVWKLPANRRLARTEKTFASEKQKNERSHRSGTGTSPKYQAHVFSAVVISLYERVLLQNITEYWMWECYGTTFWRMYACLLRVCVLLHIFFLIFFSYLTQINNHFKSLTMASLFY